MKMILLFLTGLTALSTHAQTVERNPFPKTITVSGSAEMNLVPDEIYVQVDLREYDRKNEGKKPLEQIQAHFFEALRSAGIPDSAVTIAAYAGQSANPWQRKKNKTGELFASVSYQIKFSSSRKIDELVEKLDDNATQNFFIVKTTHSRLPEYRRQLKIEAVKAAREKGIYLTEAIGEKLGEAITINEPSEYFWGYMAGQKASNVMLREEAAVASNASVPDPSFDFRKIRLQFEVSIVFALK